MFIERVLELHKKGEISDVSIIKMADFKSTFLQLARHEKSPAKAIATGLGILGVAGLADYALEEAREWREKNKLDKQLDVKFGEVLRLHPKLNSFPRELVWEQYKSLAHYSPTVAKDPLMAGSYLLTSLSTMEVGGLPIEAIQTVSKIERNVQEARFPKARVAEPFAPLIGKVFMPELYSGQTD